MKNNTRKKLQYKGEDFYIRHQHAIYKQCKKPYIAKKKFFTHLDPDQSVEAFNAAAYKLNYNNMRNILISSEFNVKEYIFRQWVQRYCHKHHDEQSKEAEIVKYLTNILHMSVKASSLYYVMRQEDKELIQAITNLITPEEASMVLCVAAQKGNVKIFEEMLNKNDHLAQLDKICIYSKNSLHLAAENNHVNIIKKIIEKSKLDVDNKTKYNYTALYLAVKYDALDAAQLLLSHGANITEEDEECCPLLLAIRMDKLPMVKALITAYSQRGNIYINKAPMLALIPAIIYEKIDIVKYLARQCIMDNDTEMPEGENAIFYALCTRNAEIVHEVIRLFVEENISINAVNNNGMSALYAAIDPAIFFAYKYTENQDIHLYVDNHIDKPKSSSEHLVKIMISAGAMIDIKDKNGNTPLHFAAEKGQADAVQILIDYNAEIWAKNHNGFTALHLAILSGNVKTVENILHYCTDRDLNSCSQDLTLLKEQIANNSTPTIDMYQKLAVELKKAPPPLLLAMQTNNPIIIDLLISKKGIDPNIEGMITSSFEENNIKTPMIISPYKFLLMHKSAYEMLFSGTDLMSIFLMAGNQDDVDPIIFSPSNSEYLNRAFLCEDDNDLLGDSFYDPEI